MLAALGLFVFELPTLPFSEAQRRRGWRHESADRFGARAASQFVGTGDDTVTFSGALVPGVAGSFAAIDTLIDMGDRGDTYQLVGGDGAVWGGFVIVGLDTRSKHIMVDGTPRLVDFTLDLRRVE